MSNAESSKDQKANTVQLEFEKVELEKRRLELDDAYRSAQLSEEIEKRQAAQRHHRDDVRLKLTELRTASGRGLRFSAAQATVAAALLAVISAVGGAVIQALTTRHVEAGKSLTALSIEKTKVDGELQLARQKQSAATELARQEFETKLILKAIETPDRKEAITNLQFFLKAGFIQDPHGSIANLEDKEYPSITPPECSFRSLCNRELCWRLSKLPAVVSVLDPGPPPLPKSYD